MGAKVEGELVEFYQRGDFRLHIPVLVDIEERTVEIDNDSDEEWCWEPRPPFVPGPRNRMLVDFTVDGDDDDWEQRVVVAENDRDGIHDLEQKGDEFFVLIGEEE